MTETYATIDPALRKRVGETLNKAADLLEKTWTVGYFKRKISPNKYTYCAVGAIREIAPGEENQAVRRTAYNILSKEMKGNQPPNLYSHRELTLTPMEKVINFNDRSHDGGKRVRGLFRRVAEKLI